VRDWSAAIELAQRLERDFRENHRREIAHFHCELAQLRLASKEAGALNDARHQVDTALRSDPEHARAHLLLGSIAYQDANPQAAILAWENLLKYSPAHLALVIVDWLAAHRAVGRAAAGIEQAETLLIKHPSSDIFAALAETKAAALGAEAAQVWAEQQLRKTPSLLGLEKLLAIRAQSTPNERHGDMELIQKMIQAQARRLSRYVCGHCGFKARQFYWQCAGCNRWDTYAPKRSEELEV
jgi:lipopolysaccharide assembly protein B